MPSSNIPSDSEQAAVREELRQSLERITLIEQYTLAAATLERLRAFHERLRSYGPHPQRQCSAEEHDAIETAFYLREIRPAEKALRLAYPNLGTGWTTPEADDPA